MSKKNQTLQNLFSGIPSLLPDEVKEIMLRTDSVRIERIISAGHRSPSDFWYEQAEHEWVVVLSGAAKLVFEDEQEPLVLNPGDSVNIVAGRRHRVEWTTDEEPTVWLGVFYH